MSIGECLSYLILTKEELTLTREDTAHCGWHVTQVGSPELCKNGEIELNTSKQEACVCVYFFQLLSMDVMLAGLFKFLPWIPHMMDYDLELWDKTNKPFPF